MLGSPSWQDGSSAPAPGGCQSAGYMLVMLCQLPAWVPKQSTFPKAVSQFLSQQTGTEASSCHHCRAKPAGPWHPQPPLTQHKPLLSAPGIPAGSTCSSAALSQTQPSESRGQRPHWGPSQRTFQSDAGGQEHRPSQGTQGQPQHTQGPLVLLLSCPWLSESSSPSTLSTTLLPSAATLRMFHELSIFAPARSPGASCCPGSSQSREAPETNHSPGNSSACGQGRQSNQRQQGGMLLGGPCPGTTEPLQHPGCFGTGHTALACQDSVGTLSFGQLFPPFLCLQSNMSQPGRQAKQRSCPAASALSPHAVLFQQKPYSMQINHPIPCKPARHWVLPTRPPSPGVQRALQPVYPDFNRPL